MAESSVAVTVGAGTLLHTNTRVIGGNTVHDEVVGLGEPNTLSYTLQLGAHSAATANAHIFQLMAGSSLKVRIRRIEIWQFALVTTAAVAQVDLFRLTTAGTGGGSLTPANLDPGDAAAGATGMSLPTGKGTEGSIIARAMPYLLQTVPASGPNFGPLFVWDFDRPRSKPLIIAAGTTNGIALKWITANTGATVTGTIWFDETAWA